LPNRKPTGKVAEKRLKPSEARSEGGGDSKPAAFSLIRLTHGIACVVSGRRLVYIVVSVPLLKEISMNADNWNTVFPDIAEMQRC
jgi:hypothetical protein